MIKKLVPKKDLEHGAYYMGKCRNASWARWNQEKDCFVHWRTKFKQRFLETIKHPDDDFVHDVFYPHYKADDVPEDVRIPDDRWDNIEC